MKTRTRNVAESAREAAIVVEATTHAAAIYVAATETAVTKTAAMAATETAVSATKSSGVAATTTMTAATALRPEWDGEDEGKRRDGQ